jgi:hypothetical protein
MQAAQEYKLWLVYAAIMAVILAAVVLMGFFSR